MKKRILSMLLMLAMVVVLMTGCGGKKTTAEANFNVPEVGYDGSEVTVKFYSSECNRRKRNIQNHCCK